MIYFLLQNRQRSIITLMTMFAYFYKTMPDFVDILEKETGVALSWLEQNEMITNPEEFHAILLRKNQTNTSGEKTNTYGKIINSEETVNF